MLAKLSLTTGAMKWTPTRSSAAAANAWSALENVVAHPTLGVLVLGEKNVVGSPLHQWKFHSYGQLPNGQAILYRFDLATTGTTPPTEADDVDLREHRLHRVQGGAVPTRHRSRGARRSQMRRSSLNAASGAVIRGPANYGSSTDQITDQGEHDNSRVMVLGIKSPCPLPMARQWLHGRPPSTPPTASPGRRSSPRAAPAARRASGTPHSSTAA